MIEKIKISKNWEWVELSSLLDFVIGGDWGKDEDFEDSNYGFAYCIRGSEIRNWEAEKGNTASLRKIKHSNIEKRKLIAGDILVEISGGGPEQPVGRTVLIDRTALGNHPEIPKICTNFLRLIRPKKEINSKFLNLFLGLFYYSGEIVKYQGGSNNLRNLKFPDYLKIKIPTTIVSEQNAIVSKVEELFSEIDKGIEDLRIAQQQLKVYRQAVLKSAFEGKLTSASIEEGKLPKKWKTVFITELAEKSKNALKAGPFGSALKKEFYVEKGFKIYGQEQVISGNPFLGNYYVNEEKYKELNSCRVKANDILISLVGTVGKVLLLPENCEEGIINPRLIKISLDRKVYSPKFFKYYFESSAVKAFYSSETRGTTMDVLNLGIVKTILFPLCTLAEQEFIVTEIESRLSVADKMEETITQSLQQAEALRQSILKKAFEGKLLEPSAVAALTQKTQINHGLAKIIPFERKILAVKIIQMLHKDKYFGLTKFQKVFYVAENFSQPEYETNFLQQTAGPYDQDFTLAFRKEMQEKDWVKEVPKAKQTFFAMGSNSTELTMDYEKLFQQKADKIDFVINLLKDKNTHEAELIATLYAVWNNRLIKKKPVKINLLTEDFFNWSGKKIEEFQEVEVQITYDWMSKIGLVPKGYGKVI